MKLAIMQPYFFPHIGYFQLLNAVDKFVIYDDVNFIKKGWINRNNILFNHKAHLITIPIEKVSQNKLINETKISSQYNPEKLLKIINQTYKKAPHFNKVIHLIEAVLFTTADDVGQLAANSLVSVLKYLEIEKEILISSQYFSSTKGLNKASRLIEITKQCQEDIYINPIGGVELYDKESFEKQGVKLYFIKPKDIIYKQFNHNFIPNLSIIDVLMFNSKDEIHNMLKNYQLL